MNSKLYNKYYNIPENILGHISNKLEEYKDIDCTGKKKANFVLREKKLTYQNLKKYKNFFDSKIRGEYGLNSDDESINEQNIQYEYELSGGDLMRNFVENTLKKEREKIRKGNHIKTEYGGMYNQFNKETPHDNLKINTQSNFIRESEEKKKNIQPVALTVIFNNENKILLLRRSKNTDWCPDCWAIVGGKIEKGELPEKALVREVYEETKIKIDKYKFKKIIKSNNIVEYLYISRVYDDFVQLNGEHSDYKWLDIEEIKSLENKVPDLINYIKYVII